MRTSAAMEASARRRTFCVVLMRLLPITFGVLTLVYVWKGEVPWQPLLEEQSEHTAVVAGHSLFVPLVSSSLFLERDQAGSSTPLELNAGAGGNTENKSFLQTLTEVLVGFLLFPMSVLLLWRNEGHSVRIAQLLDLAKRRVKEVSSTVDPERLRELVCVTGESSSQDTLNLETYDVTAPPNSAKLRAKVWMYQWVETKKDNDNSVTYTYSKKWVDGTVNSDGFHDKSKVNTKCPLEFLTRKIATTQLGDFKLPHRVMGQLQRWQEVAVSEEWLDGFVEKKMSGYQRGVKAMHKEGDGLQRPKLPVLEFALNRGDNIGDVRLCLEYVPCGVLTVIGVQTETADAGWTFVPLQYNAHASFLPSFHRASTDNTNLGDSLHKTLLGESEADFFEDQPKNAVDQIKRGFVACLKGFPSPSKMVDEFLKGAARDEILFAVEEKLSATEALKMEATWENKLVNAIRLAAVILMYLSICSIFSPLRWIFAHIWLLGAIANGALTLVALIMTCCCSSLTISLACCAYRPLLATGVLGGAAALFYLFYQYEAQQKHISGPHY